MDDVAIAVNGVTKTFKLPHERHSSLKSALINFRRTQTGFERQVALDDITFDVKKGDFFAIVGRNGGGKSTLLKMLAGIYSPDKGSITINGKLTPFIELGVGFNHELTGRENVYLNGALLGFSRKEMDKMYDDIVSFAELRRFMDQKLKNYSSGMQVRLAFSIAIRAKSDILLLDEVLAVGDAAFQQKCYNYFEKLKRQKKTVVFVSHDMSAVKRFCNKAVYIKSGKMIMEGTPDDVADLYVQENLPPAPKTESKEKVIDGYTITIEASPQPNDTIVFDIAYKAPADKKDEPLYAGMSISRDGISIAEITTPPDTPISGKGVVKYTLRTDIFNRGTYTVGVGLFRVKNRELVAATPQRVPFTLKGEDITRGATIRLADTWQY